MTAIQRIERAFCDQIEGLTEEQAQTLIDENGDPCSGDFGSHLVEAAGGRVLLGTGLPEGHPYR